MRQPEPLRVGLAGFGSIGSLVGRHLVAGVPGLAFTAVAGRDDDKTRRQLAELGATAQVVPLSAIAADCDVVVDCAPPHLFRDVCADAIERGRCVVTVSATALIEHPDLLDAAERTGARVILVSGSLLGFDAIRAAACGTIHSAALITRKPPLSLLGNDWIDAHGIDVRAITMATCIFEGSAREAARAFPDKFNVAATLALASVGPDRTRVEVWLDPAVERNIHRIVVDADSTSFDAEIRNVPNPGHKGTGPFTAYHVIAALRDLTTSFRVGT